MSVRRIGPQDVATAELAVERLGDGVLGGRAGVAAYLERPEVTLLVAEDGGEVVGWVYGHELAHPGGARTMLLYALDVADDARRRGHGAALSRAFVEDARARGCSEVWVLTEPDNDAALRTYAAAGGRREPDPSAMVVWTLTDDPVP